MAWIAASAWQLWRGAQAAQDGIAAIDRARGMLSGSDLVAERPLRPLAAARADFARARDHLDWPLLAPARYVPVLGRQLESVQDLASAAEAVTSVGESAITQAHVVLQLPHHAGPERVATLKRISALATSTNQRLDHLDLGPSNALIGPLARRRTTFANQLDRVRIGLRHSAEVTAVTADVLQGPRTYLLVAANNAEMRAGSGTFLQLGLVTTQGGHIQVGQTVPSADRNPAPGQVPIRGDLAARWGWLQPSDDWRNLGLTPQFDVNGALAAQMWAASTGAHVDGVIAVDVATLQQLLTVTGPVTVGGDTIGPDNAVPYLLHDQYAGLPASATDQTARRDRLGSLASATLDALEARSIDLSALATAMTGVAQGRHLMLWSGAPAEQVAWEAGGVAGRLGPNDLLAAVVNRGGNKLDQFLEVNSRLSLSQRRGNTDATLVVHLANNAPAGEAPYIVGPYPGLGTVAGEYVGLFAVNLPGSVFDASIEGLSSLAASGPEGPTLLLAAPIDLRAGSQRDLVVHFSMAGTHGSLRVVPTARLPAVTWSAVGDDFKDSSAHTVSW